MLPTSQGAHDGGQDESHDCSDDPYDDRDHECLEPADVEQAPEGKQPDEAADQGREEGCQGPSPGTFAQVLMICRPALRFFTGPRPPFEFAARRLAGVIRPPLLFFAMFSSPSSVVSESVVTQTSRSGLVTKFMSSVTAPIRGLD
jgi:hypothetical protein